MKCKQEASYQAQSLITAVNLLTLASINIYKAQLVYIQSSHSHKELPLLNTVKLNAYC